MIKLVAMEVITILCFLYCNHIIQTHSFYFNIVECVGPLTPKVVQSTAYYNGNHPASSVLILGEEDGGLDNGKANYWLAEEGKTTGQGFTVRVDYCARMIAGVQIKNTNRNGWSTYEFKVSASLNKQGPWETMVESFLRDTTNEAAPLLNFTFNQQVKLKYLKFELISYHDGAGGGLQYFAAIPATSEYDHKEDI